MQGIKKSKLFNVKFAIQFGFNYNIIYYKDQLVNIFFIIYCNKSIFIIIIKQLLKYNK